MNIRRFFGICALALLVVVSTGRGGFSAQWDLDELTVWPGFGDAWNRYTYTQVYYEGNPADDSDDAIYLGTFNQRLIGDLSYGWYDEVNGIEYGAGSYPATDISKGGRIWKYTISTGHWKLIWPRLDLSSFDPNDFGWRIAKVYDPPGDGPDQGAKVYFGSYSSGVDARLMVIDPANDSVNFIEPAGGWSAYVGGGYENFVSIRAMAVFNDKLYLGSEYPGKLWSYDGTNVMLEWVRPGNLLSAYNISELEVYGGYLYIGGWFSSALYRTDGSVDGNGDLNVENVDIGPAADEEGVMTIEVFQGKLFVGTADRSFGISDNPKDGFSLFYYDSADDPDPTFVTQDAFGGGGGNGYAWFLRQCGELAFLGVFTGGGVDQGLWAASDPSDPDSWTNLTGFYDPTPSEYGVRSLSCGIPGQPGVDNESLFYGTADNLEPNTLRFPGGTRIFRIEGPFTALP